MGHLVTAVPIIFIIWLLVQVTRLYANYAKANRAGLPIIVAPFVQYNMAWGLFQTFFQPEKWLIPLLQAVLPEPASRFTRVIHMNWVRENGPDLHRRLGPVFFIVSPSCIVFISADNLANTDFLTNAKKWTRLFPNEGRHLSLCYLAALHADCLNVDLDHSLKHIIRGKYRRGKY